MDSVPSQVAFEFARLRSDADDPGETWQLLLRVVADFSVSVRGRLFYSEPEFPVIEFASQASKWAGSSCDDFRYVSMEAEDDPLLEFRAQPSGRYKIVALHQEFDALEEFDRNELHVALGHFLDKLKSATRQLGLEIAGLL